MAISQQARDLAAKTSDAYSFQRYASWPAVIDMLLRRGYSERQVEAIVRSKWTRWAHDHSNARYGRCTANDLARYMATIKNLNTQVIELEHETFSEAT